MAVNLSERIIFSSDLIARIIASGRGAAPFAARDKMGPGYLAFHTHYKTFVLKDIKAVSHILKSLLLDFVFGVKVSQITVTELKM